MWRYLLAFTLFQVAFSAQTLDFELSEDNDVAIQNIDVPWDGYNGGVQSSITPLANHDLLLCINWLAPAETPLDVNLSTVWPAACDFTQSIPRAKNGKPVDFTSQLRTGVNYFSLYADDMDSVGSLPVSLDYTIGPCAAGTAGPDCLAYTMIQYDQVVVASSSPQFLLPTLVGSSNFVQNLNFNFSGNLAGASISARLSGPVLPGFADFTCADLTKSCQIVSPPMTKSNSFWVITVNGTNVNFTVHANTCKSNAGSSCKTTLNDGTKLKNTVTQSSGAQYYTFPAPAFDVAVGGLDGYVQTDAAPNITVQIDNIPTMLVLSSGINAKSNRLTINMTGSPLITVNSTFIVLVNAKGSFGIWIPNDNSTCPNNCSGVGECVDYTCACPTGGKPEYNGLGCEHEVKSFTIEYVILIAVGGLLVLSIVIGVPVYCWMNRHPEYETVA